jgi:hypothetical protein
VTRARSGPGNPGGLRGRAPAQKRGPDTRHLSSPVVPPCHGCPRSALPLTCFGQRPSLPRPRRRRRVPIEPASSANKQTLACRRLQGGRDGPQNPSGAHANPLGGGGAVGPHRRLAGVCPTVEGHPELVFRQRERAVPIVALHSRGSPTGHRALRDRSTRACCTVLLRKAIAPIGYPSPRHCWWCCSAGPNSAVARRVRPVGCPDATLGVFG